MRDPLEPRHAVVYLVDLGVNEGLSLLSCGGLSGTDGPDGLVGDNDLSHVLSGELEQDVLDLAGDDLEVLSGLSLIKVLSDHGTYKYATAERAEKNISDRMIRIFAASVVSMPAAE